MSQESQELSQQSQDTEVKRWLRETLGSDDAWNSSKICHQMSPAMIGEVKCSLHGLPTQVKLKTLLSFMHLSRRLLTEWKTDIEDLYKHTLTDADASVRMLAEILLPFPSTQRLNDDITTTEESKSVFNEFSEGLTEALEMAKKLNLIPLECYYMNKNALDTMWIDEKPPVKHFTIKRKTKSEKLREELLVAAKANKETKTNSPPDYFPKRIRVVPKKIALVFRKNK